MRMGENVRTGTINAPAWLQTLEGDDEPSGLQALEEDVAFSEGALRQ